MRPLLYPNKHALAGITMKDETRPEANNMAVHKCLDAKAVITNRQHLAEQLNLPLDHWVLPDQKHTANWARVTQEDWGKGCLTNDDAIACVDALYTTEKNTLIGVFTADCLGMALVDEHCVAVIHSGWKGTVQEIAKKLTTHLIEQQLIQPETTRIYFSPSLAYKSLELGWEVIEQLPKEARRFVLDNGHKAFFDNQGYHIQLFKELGISHLAPSTFDTKTDRGCFSYRKDKQTGEHMTFAFLRDQRQ